MTTLVTFLGRMPKSEKGTYRRTRYDYGDGQPEEALAFFGWSLWRRLAPDRVVILGTEASRWDHLFEEDLPFGREQEAERMVLMESAEKGNVTQAQLDGLRALLASRLGGEVALRIIPYCRNDAEQTRLLSIMAEEIAEGETVHLDVTHGFRHLPMLTLLAALYLRRARRAEIAGIWYGAYDPDTNKAPVYNLAGLLRLAEGLDALAAFDRYGDYRVFCDFLRATGQQDLAGELDAAGYYENILNVGEAAGRLRPIRAALRDLSRQEGAVGLLASLIVARTDWLGEDRQYEKQLFLAREALEKRDYLRAVLYAYEAVITRLCQQRGVPINEFDAREKARKEYEAQVKGTAEGERFLLLKNLRNQVAHGTRGTRGDVQQALLNEWKMRETLSALLSEIENGRLPASPQPD